MNKVALDEKEDFITLGQLLKYTGTIQMGGEAKWFLMNHEVYVNGEREMRRGKKLREGDRIKIAKTGEFVIGRQ
ncbi:MULTISPECIES: S4 domain-containing protein YaaA [unclassified Sporolactobacillus]|uniref:S4 domain-containing protein YaaA n=1 Tax=unclassified Sporolactobacillus TaxID=2628533 RepID=UPI002367D026|nr:S4 domain-containing protein YaaA [Sporolactobacillus sp. CQH2019]MDD9148498.1 S4 domain-containing protein YaaA [Sporolactobacillus sp. CQH2019]